MCVHWRLRAVPVLGPQVRQMRALGTGSWGSGNTSELCKNGSWNQLPRGENTAGRTLDWQVLLRCLKEFELPVEVTLFPL